VTVRDVEGVVGLLARASDSLFVSLSPISSSSIATAT
jgi:hypothetical protein